MNRLEMLVDRLREVADMMDSPQKRTLVQAADWLENQRREIDALHKMLEVAHENQRG